MREVEQGFTAYDKNMGVEDLDDAAKELATATWSTHTTISHTTSQTI